MSLSTLDDAALLEGISRGSREAFSALYDRHGRNVFGLALRLVGDQETAEEIVQDVFTSVWRSARTWRAGRGRPAAWIARIARNRAIDELRRRGARPKAQGGSWEAGSGGEAAGENPADQAELALERRRVRAALGSLPAEQREALSLAFFQGRSHSEIAEALGQPLGTVKTRIRLGMQRLQRLLAAEGEG